MKINSIQAPGQFKPGQVILLKNFQDVGTREDAPPLKIDEDVEILIPIKYIIYTESHIEIGFLPVEVSYVSNMAYLVLKTIFIDHETENCTVDCAYMWGQSWKVQEIEAAMKVDLFLVD